MPLFKIYISLECLTCGAVCDVISGIKQMLQRNYYEIIALVIFYLQFLQAGFVYMCFGCCCHNKK